MNPSVIAHVAHLANFDSWRTEAGRALMTAREAELDKRGRSAATQSDPINPLDPKGAHIVGHDDSEGLRRHIRTVVADVEKAEEVAGFIFGEGGVLNVFQTGPVQTDYNEIEKSVETTREGTLMVARLVGFSTEENAAGDGEVLILRDDAKLAVAIDTSTEGETHVSYLDEDRVMSPLLPLLGGPDVDERAEKRLKVGDRASSLVIDNLDNVLNKLADQHVRNGGY